MVEENHWECLDTSEGDYEEARYWRYKKNLKVNTTTIKWVKSKEGFYRLQVDDDYYEE